MPPPDWANQHVTARNREPMHAPWGAYASADQARTGDRSASPRTRSLDGVWRFRLVDRPEDAPAGFHQPGFDDNGWADLPVPANWELHGHGRPIYTNIPYPFKPVDPPHPPQENPTGCYRTAFTVPEDWADLRVFVEFEAVESAFTLWVNGREIGYSQDSKLPAAFEITDAVRPGENLLAARVLRYSDGAYLEDQDYWHLSGIQRPVRLVAKPRIHLRDVRVATHLDAACRDAVLDVRAYMTPTAGLRAYSVEAALYAPDGAAVWDAPRSEGVCGCGPMGRGVLPEFASAHFREPVEAPQLWTAETPHLYTLVLTLRDGEGNALDHESARVGFRQVEIRDGVLCLNGRRLVIRGVDRHEHHPARGRALTEDDMIAEIRAMKRLNFNAVRTSHYPDCNRWYELCDEYGVYLVDEADLETHAVGGRLSRDPTWAAAYLERAQRMVLRDRNHPSVIAWSLGNESSFGPNHAAMAGWIREIDPTRPVQYESGDPGPAITDILAPMYPPLDYVEAVLARPDECRPLVMCEYAYAKGNSTGNFHEFWDLVHRLPRFQGGFLWDWADKALEKTHDDGSTEWGYGDLRDEPEHTRRMCLNGIVFPDLSPKPGAREVQAVQAPVGFFVPGAGRLEGTTALEEGRIGVRNRHLALSLDHLELVWRLAEDGRILAEGGQDCPDLPAGMGYPALHDGLDRLRGVEPGVPEAEVRLDYGTLPAPAPGAERHLRVAVRLKEATPWADAGHEVAWADFAVPTDAAFPVVLSRTDMEPVAVEKAEGAIRITAGDAAVAFDAETGELRSLLADGAERLAGPMRECFFRAPTDIDHGITHLSYGHRWLEAGLDDLVHEARCVEAAAPGASAAVVRVEKTVRPRRGGEGVRCRSVFTVFGSGDVLLEATVDAHPSLPPLPRIGMELALPLAFDRFAWFGRGPHECYPDRKRSAWVGLHETTVAEAETPYIFPQECGGREDVRRLTLTDAEGAGLLVVGEPTVHASALPHHWRDLHEAKTRRELPDPSAVHLHVDGFMTGLGGDTGWFPNIHPPYLLRPGRYRYAFRLRAIRPGEDAAALARRSVG